MPLYKILSDGQTLEKVDRKGFSNEQELHSLVENNLPNMLGIRLIAREFSIPNGRIDTLGLDEDGIPVIIEYKWKKDLSSIVQGLFYLDWVMQNKKPFEAIVKDKLGVEVTWSTQPRLLIIAQGFDIKELAAINQMSPRIELMKYSLYDGLFSIENVNIVESKSTPPQVSGQNIEEHTIENLLTKMVPNVQELFIQLRERILGISDAVWEKVHSSYCDYRTITTFASVNVQKSQLKILIKMGDKEVDDPDNICKSILTHWGWGLMSKQFSISSQDEIDYAMMLIMQAYNYVSE